MPAPTRPPLCSGGSYRDGAHVKLRHLCAGSGHEEETAVSSLLTVLPADRLQCIDVLVLDVDGVLTDGGIAYTAGGDEVKQFHVRDGSGLKYWHRSGKRSAILSGRSSPVVERRARELGIECVRLGAKDKLPVLHDILAQLAVSPACCAYVGDDLPDLPPMRACGLSIAVADGAAEVRETADAVTEQGGGRGAVREVIEALLRAQGLWATILSRYIGQGEV